MAPPQGLDFQLVDVKFQQGLDTRTQPKLVLPGKWNDLENLTLTANYTPARRDGMASILAGTFANGLATNKEQLLLVTGDGLSSISTAVPQQVFAGVTAHVELEAQAVARLEGFRDSPDCATSGAFTCYAWRDIDLTGNPTAITCMLVDEATGARLIAPTAIDTTGGGFDLICPRVVFAFDCFYVLWINNTSLKCCVIQTSSPTSIGPPTTLINSADLVFANFDAIDTTFPNASFIIAAYQWSDGTDSVRNAIIGHTGSIPTLIGSAGVISNADVDWHNLQAITICQGDLGFYMTFVQAFPGSTLDGAIAVVVDFLLAIQTPAHQIGADVGTNDDTTHIAACVGFSGFVWVVTDHFDSYGTTGNNNKPQVVIIDATTSAVVVAQTFLTVDGFCSAGGSTAAGPQGPFICGKPYYDGQAVLVPMCTLENYTGSAQTPITNAQNAFFLLNIASYQINPLYPSTVSATNGLVAAKGLYGTFGSPPAALSPSNACAQPCNILSLGGTAPEFALAVPQVTRLVIETDVNVSPIGITRLDLTSLIFSSGIAPVKAQLGPVTYFAGGALMAYDGAFLSEQGFFLYPEGISVASVATGGFVTAGVHAICALYEWTDAAGNRTQSAPSPVVSVTSAALDHITVIVQEPMLSSKGNYVGTDSSQQPVIVVYMTQANGTEFNRVGSIVGDAGRGSAQTFTITQSDADIAGNELLYSQPLQADTTLANISPPPCTCLGVHQNRLFLNNSEVQGEYWFSQPYVAGVGLQFSDELTGQVDVSGGRIIAISELDEKIVFLCEHKLFAVFGTGPSTSGAFNNYSAPQQIPSDVGCLNAQSVLRMPNGIIFKSAKGFYLLGRDLSVKYIGKGVAQWDSATVTSATMMEDRQECRFTAHFTGGLLASSGDAEPQGFSFVYSYDMPDADGVGQWSVNSVALDAYVINDALYWRTLGAWVHTSSVDGLNKDTPGIFIDAEGNRPPEPIITAARTAWLKLSSIANYQRVRWLYLTMTAGADGLAGPSSTFETTMYFDDSYDQATNKSYTTLFNLAAVAFPSTSIDLRHKLKVQKCKSIAFQFIEVPADSDGTRLLTGMQALAMQVGLKKGINKLSAGQTVPGT